MLGCFVAGELLRDSYKKRADQTTAPDRFPGLAITITPITTTQTITTQLLPMIRYSTRRALCGLQSFFSDSFWCSNEDESFRHMHQRKRTGHFCVGESVLLRVVMLW